MRDLANNFGFCFRILPPKLLGSPSRENSIPKLMVVFFAILRNYVLRFVVRKNKCSGISRPEIVWKPSHSCQAQKVSKWHQIYFGISSICVESLRLLIMFAMLSIFHNCYRKMVWFFCLCYICEVLLGGEFNRPPTHPVGTSGTFTPWQFHMRSLR